MEATATQLRTRGSGQVRQASIIGLRWRCHDGGPVEEISDPHPDLPMCTADAYVAEGTNPLPPGGGGRPHEGGQRAAERPNRGHRQRPRRTPSRRTPRKKRRRRARNPRRKPTLANRKPTPPKRAARAAVSPSAHSTLPSKFRARRHARLGVAGKAVAPAGPTHGFNQAGAAKIPQHLG